MPELVPRYQSFNQWMLLAIGVLGLVRKGFPCCKLNLLDWFLSFVGEGGVVALYREGGFVSRVLQGIAHA